MRHLLIAACLSGAFATSALAADMPKKSPAAAPAPTYNWTGFYVNGGVAYGLWTADTTTVSPTTGLCVLCLEQRQGGRGWLGTVGAGFDYQFSPRIVGGLFGDADFGSISGTIQDQTPIFSGTTKENWAWAVGARAGWIPTPGILAYVNGGFTQAHFTSATMTDSGGGIVTPYSTPGFTRGGWFIGGGVERILWPGWLLRTEYRYADYGTTTLTDAAPGGTPVVIPGLGPFVNPQANITFHPIVQTVRSEIVYKFGGGMIGLPNNAGPLPPAPNVSWTGFYVNGGFGYGMWAADTTTLNPTTGVCFLCVEQRQGGRGWLGTVGAGFDYQLVQINPHIVVGVFGDFDFASLSGTIQDQFPFFAGTTKEDRAWAVGARGGWLISPAIMTYVNGGFTQAHFTSVNMVVTLANGPATPFSTSDFTRGGWFLGGGAEAMFAPGWLIRAEYRYADYGTATLTDTAPGGPVIVLPVVGGTLNPQDSITFHPIVQTIRTGLVYKFGWPR